MIEVLSTADVPDDVALSRAVGWPDTEADWRVLHAASHVLGIRSEQRLVAHGALGDYGAAATLAKMVVAPDQQRRGLGAELLDALLARADARGVPVGLVATELGLSLYRSRGFRESGQVAIFAGSVAPGTRLEATSVAPLDAATAIQLDRRFTGCDRSRMLAARLRESCAACGLAGGGAGFGMITEQEPFSVVGPIMAESELQARALAGALITSARGPFRIDVPVERTSFRAWLAGIGLREQALRREMARGVERTPWQCEQRYALATQAWG